MARITIEDCLKRIENRFALVHLGAARARQLVKGSAALVRTKNKYIITALREVAAGKVTVAQPIVEKDIKTVAH